MRQPSPKTFDEMIARGNHLSDEILTLIAKGQGEKINPKIGFGTTLHLSGCQSCQERLKILKDNHTSVKNVWHPSPSTLRMISKGKLKEANLADHLKQHMATCSQCQELLRLLKGKFQLSLDF